MNRRLNPNLKKPAERKSAGLFYLRKNSLIKSNEDLWSLRTDSTNVGDRGNASRTDSDASRTDPDAIRTEV
jgi:hypothetical protein